MPHPHAQLRPLARAAASLALALALVLVAPSVARADGRREAVGAVPFPRTALWWPAQGLSLDGLARYDLLVLGHHDREIVPGLRARRPGQLVLDSANACEIPYDPYSPAGNAELRAVPAQWLLTQVGSTLAAPVDASATSLRVQAVTGPGGLALFQTGDAIVIDGEIAYVWSVDAANKVLHLRRGAVNPPKSHAAGTRVAAAISFWGRSLVFDLSTHCPKRTAEVAYGAEDWASYNARRGAALMKTAAWDGLLVDRADGNESWLIGHSTARSIDPDRSNRVPADYGAFDAAWNAGLLAYERRLRAGVGEDRIVIGNWARPNMDVLDGSIFEAFPKASGVSYNGSWRETVFGPLPGFASYLDWMASPRKPAVGVIATHELDATLRGQPGAAVPLAPLAAVRKARFGLGTALLGDGFFAYEYNVSGGGSDRLTWFDTYDAGGLGQGYLGRPEGAVRPALPPLATPDLLSRGDFDSASDLGQWSLMTSTGYAGTVALASAGSPAGDPCARVDITSAEGGRAWKAHLTRGSVATITAGREYTISFWAKADRSRPMSVWVQGERDDTRHLLEFGSAGLDGTWRRYELSIVADGTSGPLGARLHFGLGQTTGTAWIDGVRIQEGTTAVHRRDFSGGVVVANAAGTTQTVGLGRPFRAFTGTQDPAVDDGRTVSTVTVPPLDARILLRTTADALPRLDLSSALWRTAAERAETARRACAAGLPRASGVRARQMRRAAALWAAARDRCEAARASGASARAACAQGDSRAARQALDAALDAAEAAGGGGRDPFPTRAGRQARAAAAKALAASRVAHNTLP